MPGKLKAPSSMDGLLQVPPPAARPVVPLKASADPEFSSLALAPVPPVFGTSTDAARQFYRTGVSQSECRRCPRNHRKRSVHKSLHTSPKRLRSKHHTSGQRCFQS